MINPNLRAKDDSGGAIKVRAMMPNVPAIKEPMADMPKAAPARPFLAI